MDLLLYYINSIFVSFHFPLPAEICQDSDSIKPMCLSATSFALIFTVIVLIVTTIIFRKKLANNYALIIFSVLRVMAVFILADLAMKEIQEPARYGIEWFTMLYYLWCFILLNIFLSLILLPRKTRFLLSAALVITIILIPVFAVTGRGYFEQITPIAGGLFAELSPKMLWLSFSFKFFIFLAAIAVISGFTAFMAHWVVNGKFNFLYLKRNLLLLSIFLIMLVLPASSIPLGETLNQRDLRDAKTYIDNIKLQADKYYYENGEYPKFIEKMLPPGSSPRLLDRHEFFTYGIKGTYYFSRKDKYCFLFQNPTRKFGYYSITSERDWRYNENSDSYDNVFINLCDETNKNFDDLIAGHLGVDGKDEMVNEVASKAGATVVPATSRKASRILEDKIMEGAEKDPALQKLLGTPQDKK